MKDTCQILRLTSNGQLFEEDYGVPYIPELRPADEIRMVDLSLGIYMLSWPDNHGLGRGDVGKRSLARISVGNPYRDGESVCCPPE